MLLSVSFLGVFLAGIILLFSSYRKSKNAYLAAYLLFSNLFSLTYWLIFQSDSTTFSALFAIHITPFYFLTQPFLHLYIISHQKSFKFKAKNYLLLIPFFLVFLNILPYVLIPFLYKVQWANLFLKNPEVLYEAKMLFLPYFYQSLIRPVFNLIFIVFSAYTYFKLRKVFEFPSAKFNERAFIIFLLIISGLLNLLSFGLIIHKVLLETFDIDLVPIHDLRTASKVVGYLYAAQNLLLLFFPKILFEGIFNKQNSIKPKADRLSKFDFNISPEKFKEIEHLIQEYITSRPYLTQGFSINSISQNIGIPVHQLSHYFNDHLKTSFNDWKNHLRIEHVVSEINDGKHENFTLESLASSSGFASRANFNKAFLVVMNQTPTEYIRGLNLTKK
jgi:AraC-like DNA-binding protein